MEVTAPEAVADQPDPHHRTRHGVIVLARLRTGSDAVHPIAGGLVNYTCGGRVDPVYAGIEAATQVQHYRMAVIGEQGSGPVVESLDPHDGDEADLTTPESAFVKVGIETAHHLLGVRVPENWGQQAVV